ncbi:YeiH family protein [Paenibacillus sp. N3.4]|uniref:YeiH family protein n=1 Tax=Paenibacillus sp. N3.4 TaxID=2603222 RepID=UPI0011C9CAA4|nr:YeiH family protein [Paenibacillus sp. N3.4]TXK72419.1 YeiH family putative sulfate export transporter [Paenibacillus sp. N3.4]
MTETKAYAFNITLKNKKGLGFAQGIGLTLLLAVIAKYLAGFPFLSIMGQLVIAILLGIAWRAAVGVPRHATMGISFSNKKLLRYGIILLGMKLNLTDIVHAGPKVFTIAIIHIIFTIFVVYGISKLMKVEQRLGLLTACGVAICGAAAIAAISPQIKANDNETAISAATVAILGTMFTLCYTIIYPFLGLTAKGYGIFSGATLHEVAHVIAAAAPGGKEAVDLAVIVKLTRVSLLVPVAIVIGIWANRKERKKNSDVQKASWKSIPIPWFIVGFLCMSGVNTLGIIPMSVTNQFIIVAYLLIAMAMAGLGLHVDIVLFRRWGMKSFVSGLIGSVLLSILGYGLIVLFGLK